MAGYGQVSMQMSSSSAEDTHQPSSNVPFFPDEDACTMLLHEVRGPLTSLMGFADLLTSGCLGSLNITQQVVADHMLIRAHQLQELVNNVLEFARMEAGFLEIEPGPVNLALLVREVAAVMAPRLEQKRHRLEILFPQSGLEVRVDAMRMHQVLSNLFSCAIEHTPARGQITVVGRRDHGAVVVSVRDGAVTVLPEDISRFPAVRPPDERMRPMRALDADLGLLVVRRIVEAHGGRVWTETRVGAGRALNFSIPITD